MTRHVLSALAALWLAGPASAWSFSPDPVCTLSGGDAAMQVTVTYDPADALYRIALTRPGGWPDAPQFSITFDGQAQLTITTGRHAVTGNTLSVSDTGFGNVLFGLEQGLTATARTGEAAQAVSLAGAAPQVRRFRACGTAPIA